MITDLHVRNFKIIESADLEFSSGINVITGETGAGKSVLIHAVSTLLGDKVSKDYILPDRDYCEVSASLDIKAGVLDEFFNKHALSGDMLLIRRRVYRNGKNNCFINDCPVTVNALKELGELLVDIHSQNQHQSLLKKDKQREILDKYAGLAEKISELKRLMEQLSAVQDKEEKLKERKEETEADIELYRSEIKEIDVLELYPGIDDEIDKQYLTVRNSEIILSTVNNLCGVLYESDDSVFEKISEGAVGLEKLTDIDNTFKVSYDTLSAVSAEIENLCSELRSYIDSCDFNAKNMEMLLEKKHSIDLLKRKLNSDIEGIIAYSERLKEKINEFVNFDSLLEKTQKELYTLQKKAHSLADIITGKRKKAITKLNREVTERLRSLSMADSEFSIDISKTNLSSTGKDDIEFVIRTNPGYPFMSLSKIASGGEISRVMLALKSALASADEIPLLVFDEIDAGISAVVAEDIAREFDNLSQYHQLVVITHMPQIAACADNHIFVEKSLSDEITLTAVKALSENGRLEEITRMLGSKDKDPLAVRHAEHILGKKGKKNEKS